MLPITNMPIKFNYSSASGRKIEYIVIHDTGNKNKGAGVDNHYKYFNGGDRNASADFFVDDKKIGLFNPDLKNFYMWHCGDGAGKYGITNRNSIGIEICINVDGNYNKAIQNTADLVIYLMKQFNISLINVVRHYDASRKSCPSSMSDNNWAKWAEFKNKVGGSSYQVTVPVKTKHIYRLRKTWADDKSQIGAYSDLQNAKVVADKNPEYTVFDERGIAIYKYAKPVQQVQPKTLEERVNELEVKVRKLEVNK